MDGELEALLERVEKALRSSREYVAAYESEHMSNAALDVYIESEACEREVALLKSKIAEGQSHDR